MKYRRFGLFSPVFLAHFWREGLKSRPQHQNLILIARPMGIHRNMRFTTRPLTIAAGRRYISNQQTSSRHQLLLEIYHAAFQNLEKDSPEYNTLSRSGKVWENFFKPQDVHPYLLAQTKLQSTLDRVDKQKLFYTTVGLAQPSAVQASLQRYRLHFGNPDISPLGYIFSCTGFTSATPKLARQAFIFIIFYLIIAWNAKT